MREKLSWFYGYSGFEGEPDFTGPKRFSSKEKAENHWGVNYDTAGPFDSRADAEKHLDEWIKSNEDEPEDEEGP